ncbi:DUF6624 domain-containing protein [Spirosoma endophyticum]|uniref:Uncharacterized protein n=1 Tax=Spirosoma endophyticum TaxID=662367 RepID=A0A1I2I9W0_9BACT|nr:DUF6624 domain-containing protein [Spirosoma endophyticum]SFF39045.1 hypothetical protein SAMN05216167_1624 [Spirosoma endophyticum]
MKMGLYIGGLLCWSTTIALCQTTYANQDTAYVHAVEKAFTSLKKGDCRTCLREYQKAFAISQKSALSTLRAAVCAYQCDQIPQAQRYLRQAASIDFWISDDVWENPKEAPELNSLRNSPLATAFHQYIDQQKIAEGRNPTLERELKQIFIEDQRPRLQLDTIGKQYGFKSTQAQSLWEQMRQVDSINLPKVERMIAQYGYPGKRLVGEKQNETAWLVIQHAPLEVQEKYLPLLQEAAVQGQLSKASVALTIDRIRVRKGQKQLYGSQVHNDANGQPIGFEPIDDEVNVDKRRAEVGLPPLATYAKHWGFDYKLPNN